MRSRALRQALSASLLLLSSGLIGADGGVRGIAILETGDLFVFNERGGRGLGPPLSGSRVGHGTFLAGVGSDRVVAIRPRDNGQELVVIDMAKESIRSVRRLPDSVGSVRAVTRWEAGRVLAVSQVAVAGPPMIRVTSLDVESGAAVSQWTIGPGSPQVDWYVYDATALPEKRTLLISYHGVRSTGVDWFEVSPAGLRQCSPRPPNVGCLPGHGAVRTLGDTVLVASGTEDIRAYGRDWRELSPIKTGLARNHLMEFAVTEDPARVYALGPCDHAGGLSVVDVSNTARPPIEYRGLCGDRVTPQPRGGFVAILGMIAEAVAPTDIAIVNTATGAVAYRIRAPAQPVGAMLWEGVGSGPRGACSLDAVGVR